MAANAPKNAPAPDLASVLKYIAVCRLCTSCVGPLVPLFDDNSVSSEGNVPGLVDKIYFCTSIEVRPTEKFPPKVCQSCAYLIEQFDKFKKTCLRCNTLLANLITDEQEYQPMTPTMTNARADSSSSLTIQPKHSNIGNAMTLQPSQSEVYMPIVVNTAGSYNYLTQSANSYLPSTASNIVVIMQHDNVLPHCNVNPATVSQASVPGMSSCSQNVHSTSLLRAALMEYVEPLIPQDEYGNMEDSSQLDPLRIEVELKPRQSVIHPQFVGSKLENMTSVKEEMMDSTGESRETAEMTNVDFAHDYDIDIDVDGKTEMKGLREGGATCLFPRNENGSPHGNTPPSPIETGNEASSIRKVAGATSETTSSFSNPNETGIVSDSCGSNDQSTADTSTSPSVTVDQTDSGDVTSKRSKPGGQYIVENVSKSTGQAMDGRPTTPSLSVTRNQNDSRYVRSKRRNPDVVKNVIESADKAAVSTSASPSVTVDHDVFTLPRDAGVDVSLTSKNQFKLNEILAQDITKDGIGKNCERPELIYKSNARPTFLCSECPLVFKSKRSLTKHLAKHLGLSNFECAICGKIFFVKRYLASHINKVHPPKPRAVHNCTMCNWKFPTMNMLLKHLNERHEFPESDHDKEHNERRECVKGRNIEQFSVTRSEARNRSTTFKCVVCKETFSDPASLMVHLKSHVDGGGQKNIKKKKKKKKKQKTIQSTNSCLCSFCGRLFTHMSLLNYHMRSVHTHELKIKKTLQCNSCEKFFKCNSSLKSHIESVHETTKVPCTLCDKVYPSRTRLNQHVNRTHKPKRYFKCPICPKQYKKKVSIAIHLRSHTGETPYKCSHCPREFSIYNNMKMHERLHTGDKRYKCDRCGKCFTHNVSKKNHIKKYHKEETEVRESCVE